MGNAVDFALPDYSGADLRKLVTERRLPERWRDLAAEADHWVLLTRLSQQPERPDLLSKPLGALAAESWNDKNHDPDQLPLDMWSVELLQMLRYARGEARPRRSMPDLTLALSCWDELDHPEGTSPEAVAGERLALLDSYCRAIGCTTCTASSDWSARTGA